MSMSHNVGHWISNSKRTPVLYTALHISQHVLEVDSANYETAREGGGELKQRDIDTISVMVGLCSDICLTCLPSVRSKQK